METFLSTIVGYACALGSKLIIATAVFFAGRFLITLALKLYAKTNKNGKLDITVHKFAGNFIKVALYCILAVTIVGILGLPTASFIAAFGSVGVAIGLALQGSLSNFAGGIMLLIFKPFKAGDAITCGEVSGTVEAITLFYTYVVTPDNRSVTVPNGTLSNGTIFNNSVKEDRRVDISVRVAYGSDLDLVKNTLAILGENHPSVIVDKGVHARVASYDESAITFDFRVWCKKEDYFAVKADLLEQINEAFKIREITMPLNQLEVNLKK